ncbi:alpha/beta hydrolase [Flavobacterium sp. CYK-55]|uniref:alpha/beta hydrolase n=1 Tax=Flavobacterium sp. CYK-55 TaxID=2835529 RepID=UPI001BCD7BFA|nr:alpha/beta hydrolase [Flavobacterium sp. CYK-55]MBS7786368.1 alpha/beta hydrolase [Flavobacterium sp. CYK-55]
MKKLLILSLLIFANTRAQEKNFTAQEVNVNSLLKGTLYNPNKANKNTDLAIIIAGSGPTDRNGNQPELQNNSLKYLAESLAQNQIAAYTFDKRVIAQMAQGTLSEKDLSFDDFINDVKEITQYFKAKNKYHKIILIGHSEGSLIGMVAAQTQADAFVSIAGAGRPIDEVLIEQIQKQAPSMTAEVKENLEMLKKGQTFELKNQAMGILFRESVQPYMISWLKYNPRVEIQKLKIPVLLLNGSRDIQVPASDAELLKAAKSDAQLKIITDMNHVFKKITTDDMMDNIALSSQPDVQIMPELVDSINQFIKSH